MANALEARSPFLDHRLIEFVAALPAHFKLRGMTKKYILKKVASTLIPKKNINRIKRGFGVPIGQWFRTQLKDYLCDILLSSTFLRRGYFNPKRVKEMVNLHISRQKDYSFQLWALLMFELWHREFIDNK